jgi:hypothetical protein
MVAVAQPRREKPSPEAKYEAWQRVFGAVLKAMVEESGQEATPLVKLDLVNTAATVAASLVAGADI